MTAGAPMSTIVDAVARVCAQAVQGKHYAAGVTTDVITEQPEVVPVADDFGETGLPAVTVVMGSWSPVIGSGWERLTVKLMGAVWRPRQPLAENTTKLYADRDALVDAFIAHTKAFLHEPTLQSAVLEGGPGIRPRAIPRGGGAESRLFLTLPFTVEVKVQRAVVPQPA